MSRHLSAMFLLLVVTSSLASQAAVVPWRITLDGEEITALAAPVERGGALMVDGMALAPLFGLQAGVAGGQLWLRDRQGWEWKLSSGGICLESAGRSLPVHPPAFQRRATFYLPLEALARLADLDLHREPGGPRATLTRPQRAAAGAPDWQEVTVAKSPAEKAREATMAPMEGAGPWRARAVHLPPDRGTLRLDLGLGYAQGADWGMELTGAGTLLGATLSLQALLSQGPQGLLMEGARLTLLDPATGWGAEGGDLYSELWGTTSGARYLWHAGGGRWPALSLYAPAVGSPVPRHLLTYRDEFPLLGSLWLGGEWATDGSWLFKERLQRGRLHLSSHQRARSTGGWDGGGFFAYDLGNAMTLYGGLSASVAGTDEAILRHLGLRLPVASRIAVTLEQMQNSTDTTENRWRRLSLVAPIGPAQFLALYQIGDVVFLPVGSRSGQQRARSQEMRIATNYIVNPRAQLSYQFHTRWQQDGRLGQSGELQSRFRLSPRTHLRVNAGLPYLSGARPFFARIAHDLGRRDSVTLDYGSIAPYQNRRGPIDRNGVLLLFHRRWDVATPTRGAEISGRVQDLSGRPVPGVLVQLNNYATVADTEGRYVFRHLLPGEYRIQLDESTLPAQYVAGGAPRQVTVRKRKRVRVDFRVIPLYTISGYVFNDRNGDRLYQSEEGLAGRVVFLGDFATTSDKEGLFVFHNVPPGRHRVHLDTSRLPANESPDSPTELAVELDSSGPVSGLLFRVVNREKKILFQPLP